MNFAKRDLPSSFYRDVLYLLKRDHTPRIKVAPSLISKDAGEGVFATETVPAATPMCLYPGVYTPGLPFAAVPVTDEIVYLANGDLPPSGVSFEKNAYILNTSEIGGYIDGLALSNNNANNGHTEKRALDENTSACAHKVNHSPRSENATIVPFYWKHLFLELERESSLPEEKILKNCFEIPNSIRSDNSTWYFNGAEDRLYHFDKDAEHNILCAGVVVSSTQKVEAGEEILLNYNLKSPLPLWARGWYES